MRGQVAEKGRFVVKVDGKVPPPSGGGIVPDILGTIRVR